MLKVPIQSAGERVDVFLARQYPDYSRAFIQKWLKRGGARFENQALAKDDRLKGGESLQISDFEVPVADSKKGFKVRSEMPYPKSGIVPAIVHEDDALLVLNKPAGLVVHPAPSYTGATLIDWLREYLGNKVAKIFTDPARLGLVHRLDKDTSGVLMIAKSVKAQTSVSRQFQDRTVRKTYFAWVEGTPTSNEGVITAPVGRSKKDPTRMEVSGSGRPSETTFEVIETLKEVSLLSFHPKTGRTHQIRVHTAALGHPIIGDETYGASPHWANDFKIARPLLHARQLELTHPSTQKRVTYEAPVPTDFRAARAVFRKAFALILLGCLTGPVRGLHAEGEAAAPAKPSAKAASSAPSSATALRSLKRQVNSLAEQMASMNGEIAGLKDQLAAFDAGLAQLDAARRLRDLERALPDINGKLTSATNNSEEAKSQAIDASRKVKGLQEQMDQMRDTIDRLQRQLIQQRSREDEAPSATSVPGKKS